MQLQLIFSNTKNIEQNNIKKKNNNNMNKYGRFVIIIKSAQTEKHKPISTSSKQLI